MSDKVEVQRLCVHVRARERRQRRERSRRGRPARRSKRRRRRRRRNRTRGRRRRKKNRRRKMRRRRCAVGTLRSTSHSGGDVDLRTKAVDGRNNRNWSLIAGGWGGISASKFRLAVDLRNSTPWCHLNVGSGVLAKWMKEIIATSHYVAAQFQSTGDGQH